MVAKKEPICEVCNRPGVHTHRLDYYPACKRKTVFESLFFGDGWYCTECPEKLSNDLVVYLEGLGLTDKEKRQIDLDASVKADAFVESTQGGDIQSLEDYMFTMGYRSAGIQILMTEFKSSKDEKKKSLPRG